MAHDAIHPQTNGATPTPTPIQLSIPLPNAPGSRIHMHLTILTTSILLFLSSSSSGADTGGGAPSVPNLGSFVYAMPDRYNPTQPLSTPLYTLPSTQDFATRLAKLLARKTERTVHVGSSVSFSAAGNGGTVEEEMEGFRQVVLVVMAEVEKTVVKVG